VTHEFGYRAPQVCKIVGITYRQLDYWARTNLVWPSIADGRGSGSQRRYSYGDLVRLAIIRALLDAGVSLQSARRAIEYLHSHLTETDLSSATLVLNGSMPVIVRSGGELADLLRHGRGVFSVVSLAGIRADLDAALADMQHRQARRDPSGQIVLAAAGVA
jgi:DNA-binding transcriptional MerR regulator